MAFDAGAVVGHFTLDSSGWEAGTQKVQKSTENLTGSIFKGNLAYDLFKKAISFAVDQLKESVKAYSEHEQIVAQTNAVLKSTADASGMTAQGISNLAAHFADLTGIEDDTIQKAENVLLTFTNIGKTTFPQATSAILDMSVAMHTDLSSAAEQVGKALQNPVLGMTQLQRVGITFTDAQKAVVKQLAETGQVAKAQQIILGELDKKFGGSALAARDTFGGALAYAKMQIGDIQKAAGMYITTIGRPFVETFGNMTKSVVDFMTSQEGMDKIGKIITPIAGALSVAFSMAQTFFGYIKDTAKGILDNLTKGFSDVVGKGNETNVIFDVLGGAVKIVSIAFTILGKVVAIDIQWIVNLISIIKDSIVTLIDFGKAMADPLNPEKWKTVGKDVGDTWNAIKKTATDAFSGVKDLITSTYKEFETFGKDSQTNGDKLKSAYKTATDAIDVAMAKLKASTQETKDAVTTTNGEVEGTVTTIAQYMANLTTQTSMAGLEMLKLGAQNKNVAGQVKQSWVETFGGLSDELNTAVATFGLFSDESAQAIDNIFAHVQQMASNVLGFTSQAFDKIFSLYDMSLQNQQTLADNDYKKKKKYIEDNVQDETQKQAQLAQLDADYNAKSAAIKTKQFESQKAASIANAIMSGAEAVMMSFVNGGGWPWGLIPAGIMAGITIAEVAMIASQPTPDFSAATGGQFPGNSDILIGEKGPEIAHFGQPVQIIPNGKSSASGTNISFQVGTITSDVDMDKASLILASRVRRAMRAQ